MSAYKYFYLYRPPCYGCQPNGFIAQDGGLPKREWQSSHGPVYSFGWVEYPQPLTIEQVWKWELEPDDPPEWARYMFWNWANRNIGDTQSMIDDYVSAYRDGTGYIPDYMIDAVKILSEAGK